MKMVVAILGDVILVDHFTIITTDGFSQHRNFLLLQLNVSMVFVLAFAESIKAVRVNNFSINPSSISLFA